MENPPLLHKRLVIGQNQSLSGITLKPNMGLFFENLAVEFSRESELLIFNKIIALVYIVLIL